MTAVLPDPDLFSPGIVPDMPEDDYHAHPALSSTGLRRLSPPSCPARFKFLQDNPETSKAFDLGKAAHALALGTGPELVVLGEEGRKSNKGKALAAEAIASGGIALLPHEMETVSAMSDALREHPIAGRFINSPHARKEHSGFWRDQATGIPMRCRWDMLFTPPGDVPIVVDLKTSAGTVDGDTFAKAVEKYGYHQQGDHYTKGADGCGLGRDARFIIIAQEKKAPYLVSVFELGAMWLVIGESRNQYATKLYQRCVERNDWPDYTGGRVQELIMPPWIERNHDAALERGVFDLEPEPTTTGNGAHHYDHH